jgi:hypothetical protein
MVSKKTAVAQVKEKEAKRVLDSEGSFNLEALLKTLNQSQISIQEVFGLAASELTTRLNHLNDLNTLLKIKEASIQELAEAQDLLVNLSELREVVRKEREDWGKELEKLEVDFAQKEEDLKLELSRKNDIAQYNFDREWKMKRDQREDEEKQRGLKLKEREDLLQSREKEFNDYKALVEAMPAKIKSEVDREVAIATNAIKREHTHILQMKDMDLNKIKEMSILRESALEDRISTLLNQIEELKKTNEVANSSMRDIAKSALDSSAERKLSESLMNLNKNSESPVKGK